MDKEKFSELLESAREAAEINKAVRSRDAKIVDLADEVAALREAVEELERERDEARTECALRLHQLITCGVAASHPDPTLSARPRDYGGKWDSAQAQEVRALRADRDAARARLALVEPVVEAATKVLEEIETDEPWEALVAALRAAAQPEEGQ